MVDVDGVVATLTPGNDYRLAGPLRSSIEAINRLHEQGPSHHHVSPREVRRPGSRLARIVERQFMEWGLHYHGAVRQKPAAVSISTIACCRSVRSPGWPAGEPESSKINPAAVACGVHHRGKAPEPTILSIVTPCCNRGRHRRLL